MLISPKSLAPVDIAPIAIKALRAAMPGAVVSSEFLQSQVEHATPVCTEPSEAIADLHAFRSALATWAIEHDVLPLAAGTSPRKAERVVDIVGDRYQQIAEDVGLLKNEHLLNGTHVHIGFPDPEDRVRASNALREWLPLLLALSGNSPYWDGCDTSFASWRGVQARRWTTNGIPPIYADFDEHERMLVRLQDIGATSLNSQVSWGVRLSTKYPTLEIRVCDTQLRARHAVAIAELIRNAAVQDLQEPLARTPQSVLDAELWHAARFGVTRGIHNPYSGTHDDIRVVLEDVSERMNDSALVDELFERATAGELGAAEQRATRGHLAGLTELFRNSFLE